MRRSRYFKEHGDTFTIRCGRLGGAKTELETIVEGWGDYLFYGFERASVQGGLAGWKIGKLSVFRDWWNQAACPASGHQPGEFHSNHDGSSCFRAFRWAEVPGFLVGEGVNSKIDQQGTRQ